MYIQWERESIQDEHYVRQSVHCKYNTGWPSTPPKRWPHTTTLKEVMHVPCVCFITYIHTHYNSACRLTLTVMHRQQSHSSLGCIVTNRVLCNQATLGHYRPDKGVRGCWGLVWICWSMLLPCGKLLLWTALPECPLGAVLFSLLQLFWSFLPYQSTPCGNETEQRYTGMVIQWGTDAYMIVKCMALCGVSLSLYIV